MVEQACRDGRFDVLAIESDRVELRDSESEQGFVRKLYD